VAGVAFVALVGRVAVKRVRLAIAVLLLAIIAARPLHSAVRFDQTIAARDTRLLTRDWLLAHVPRGTALLVLGSHRPHAFGDPDLTGYAVERTPTLDPRLGIRWVVTHEHPLPFSRIPAEFETLRPSLRLERTFSPFTATTPPRGALFELRGAFYVPIAGFADVVRGGPLVRIYRVTGAGGADGAA
jgi:hypothetical protein